MHLAVEKLLRNAARLARLLELDSPAIIVENDARLLQQAYERVYDAVRAMLADAPDDER